VAVAKNPLKKSLPVDDESTQVDPEPAPGGDDEEATVFTGTPKKARETQQILEESRKLNAAPPRRELAPKLHPLIPIGVAVTALFVLLLLVNWLIKS
jgi:hypothetical protein